METAIDRLIQFAAWAKEEGYVKGESSFEAHCGLSNRYIYQLKHAGNGNIGSDKIALVVAKFPMLNVRWLCTGEGYMIIDDESMNKNISESLKLIKRLEDKISSMARL